MKRQLFFAFSYKGKVVQKTIPAFMESCLVDYNCPAGVPKYEERSGNLSALRRAPPAKDFLAGTCMHGTSMKLIFANIILNITKAWII